MEKTLLDLLPKTKELLEKLKDKPTTEERVAAIEYAIADLAILLANNENIKED